MHVCLCKGVLQAQLNLTECQRVVPNMPHLFRADQGANEHCLEGENHESKRMEKMGRKSREK